MPPLLPSMSEGDPEGFQLDRFTIAVGIIVLLLVASGAWALISQKTLEFSCAVHARFMRGGPPHLARAQAGVLPGHWGPAWLAPRPEPQTLPYA